MGKLTSAAVEYYTSSERVRDVAVVVHMYPVGRSPESTVEVECKWSLLGCVDDVHMTVVVAVLHKCCEV